MRNVGRDVHDDTIQREDDRHLKKERQTSTGHGCTILLIEGLHLLLLRHHGRIVRFILILILDRLHLRLHDLHHTGRLLLVKAGREKNNSHDEGKDNDRETDITDTDFLERKIDHIHDHAEYIYDDIPDRSQNRNR